MPAIKGRYRETQIDDDHRLKNDTYPVLKLVDGEIKRVDEPALTALNMRLRDDYTQDCAKGMLRWNKIISTAGYDFKLTLPNVAFHRQIGEFRDIHATPDGVLIDDATWNKRKNEWLPSTDDGDFIASLMTPVTEIGSLRALDLAAQGRHRQQARRFRVCEDRDVNFTWRRSSMDLDSDLEGLDREPACRGGEAPARRHPRTPRQHRARSVLASSQPLGVVARADRARCRGAAMAEISARMPALPRSTGPRAARRAAGRFRIWGDQDVSEAVKEPSS